VSPLQVAWDVLVRRTRPIRPALLLAVFATLVTSVATLGTVKVARDAATVFSSPDWGSLARLVGLLTACYFVRAIGQWVSARASARAANRLVADLRSELVSRVLAQPAVALERLPAGDTAARIVQDALLVREFALVAGAEIIPSVVILVLGLAICIALNPTLAAVALVGIPVVGTGLAHFGRRSQDEVLAVQARSGDLTQELVERLQLGLLIKVFGRERHELGRFETANRAHLAAAERAADIQTLQTPVVGFLQVVAIAGALWVGGAQILLGKLTVPDLMAFAAALGLCIDPVIYLSNGWTRIQQAAAAWMRLAPLLELEPDRTTGAERLVPESPEWDGDIVLENVTAGYVSDRPVLSGCTLSLGAGEWLALVGPSGSGKSTLGRLIVGLLEPTAGRIRWGDHDRVPRDRVSYVPQDAMLFSGTVADNIRYGKLDATDAEIREAARLALALEFVDRLPEGFLTVLDARGSNLSGGQRQRLAIARALVGKPRLLVLDEPTASLDPDSEQLVTETVESLRGTCTMVVVTHRLDTIRRADRTLSLVDGHLHATTTDPLARTPSHPAS